MVECHDRQLPDVTRHIEEELILVVAAYRCFQVCVFAVRFCCANL